MTAPIGDRSEPSDASGSPVQREARLKPDFAGDYPGLDAGVWYPATMVAQYFQARLARLPTRSGSGRRILNSTHFDFRGGTPRDEPWTGDAAEERRTVD